MNTIYQRICMDKAHAQGNRMNANVVDC